MAKTLLSLVVYAALLGSTVLTCCSAEPGALLRRQPWIKFEIQHGRIVARGIETAASRSLLSELDGKESFFVEANSEVTSLTYRYDSGGRYVVIQCRTTGYFSLTETHGENKFHFEQSSGSDLSISLSGEETQSLRGKTLWHLLLAQQAQQLGPLLKRLEWLQPTWQLQKQGAELRREAFAMASTDWPAQRSEWLTAIHELGSDDYYCRQSANRTLRNGGMPAVYFLRSLDDSAFSAELRRRVRELETSASRRADDLTVIANCLLFDRDLWLQLLESEMETERRPAAEHLSRLLERPIAFDAAGEKTLRNRQLLALRQALGGTPSVSAREQPTNR